MQLEADDRHSSESEIFANVERTFTMRIMLSPVALLYNADQRLGVTVSANRANPNRVLGAARLIIMLLTGLLNYGALDPVKRYLDRTKHLTHSIERYHGFYTISL